MEGNSARAGLVIEAAQRFFQHYLFVTESNYDAYMKEATKEAKRDVSEFESTIARLKVTIANKEKAYDKAKDLVLENPGLGEHYNLDSYTKDIEKLKADYKRTIRLRDGVTATLPTYKQYLKLFESTPVILGKIRDMKVMNALLRIFFSNFTITPSGKDFRKGSEVSYKLNEPYEGFVQNGDFVLGAIPRNIFTRNQR